jgi:periplasmic protein TonB
MQAQQFLQASLLDIVFQNRNKQYGAYNLRKLYNQRLLKSLGITLLLALIAVAFINAIKPTEKFTGIIAVPETELGKVKDKDNPDKKVEPKIEKPKQDIPLQKTLKAKADAFVTPIIVDNVVTTKIKDLRDEAFIDRFDSDDGREKIPVGVVIAPIKTKGVDSGTTKKPEPQVDIFTPTNSAEVMPEYPGGNTALVKFLKKHLQTPEGIEEGDIVSVKVKFVVKYNGEISQFSIVQDGGETYNEEVMRVLKKMPKWIPGKTNGSNVSVYFVQSVTFTAQQ